MTVRKSEVLRGVYKHPVKMTFGEYGERYMEYAKANKRSWLRDQQMLEHLKEFFGSERQLTDNLVTVRTKMQQSSGKLSLNPQISPVAS